MSKQLLVTVSIALFIAGLASIGAAYYFYTMTVRAQEVLATLIEDEKTGGAKEVREARDREALRTTEAERLVLNKIVGQDMVYLLRRIEDIGRATKVNMVVEAVSPETAHPKDASLSGASIRIVGNGAFADLLRAQEALTQVPALVRTQSFTLSHGEEGWKLASTLRVYLKDKKVTAPTAPVKEVPAQ